MPEPAATEPDVVLPVPVTVKFAKLAPLAKGTAFKVDVTGICGGELVPPEETPTNGFGEKPGTGIETWKVLVPTVPPLR